MFVKMLILSIGASRSFFLVQYRRCQCVRLIRSLTIQNYNKHQRKVECQLWLGILNILWKTEIYTWLCLVEFGDPRLNDLYPFLICVGLSEEFQVGVWSPRPSSISVLVVFTVSSLPNVIQVQLNMVLPFRRNNKTLRWFIVVFLIVFKV